MKRTFRAMHDPGKLRVYVFSEEGQADTALEAIQSVEALLTSVKLSSIAIVRQDSGGVVTFHESTNLLNRNRIASMLPFAGIVAGNVAHSRGLMKTSLSTAALLGGVLGLSLAVVINMLDLGVADDVLRELGERLDPGTSALVMPEVPDDEPVLTSVVQAAGGISIPDSLAPHLSANVAGPMAA